MFNLFLSVLVFAGFAATREQVAEAPEFVDIHSPVCLVSDFKKDPAEPVARLVSQEEAMKLLAEAGPYQVVIPPKDAEFYGPGDAAFYLNVFRIDRLDDGSVAVVVHTLEDDEGLRLTDATGSMKESRLCLVADFYRDGKWRRVVFTFERKFREPVFDLHGRGSAGDA